MFESILLVGWFNEHKNIVFKNNVFRGRNIALGLAPDYWIDVIAKQNNVEYASIAFDYADNEAKTRVYQSFSPQKTR